MPYYQRLYALWVRHDFQTNLPTSLNDGEEPSFPPPAPTSAPAPAAPAVTTAEPVSSNVHHAQLRNHRANLYQPAPISAAHSTSAAPRATPRLNEILRETAASWNSAGPSRGRSGAPPNPDDPPSSSSDDEGAGGQGNRGNGGFRRERPPHQRSQRPVAADASASGPDRRFETKFKHDSVPEWNGNTDTIVRWMGKVSDLAVTLKLGIIPFLEPIAINARGIGTRCATL